MCVRTQAPTSAAKPLRTQMPTSMLRPSLPSTRKMRSKVVRQVLLAEDAQRREVLHPRTPSTSGLHVEDHPRGVVALRQRERDVAIGAVGTAIHRRDADRNHLTVMGRRFADRIAEGVAREQVFDVEPGDTRIDVCTKKKQAALCGLLQWRISDYLTVITRTARSCRRGAQRSRCCARPKDYLTMQRQMVDLIVVGKQRLFHQCLTLLGSTSLLALRRPDQACRSCSCRSCSHRYRRVDGYAAPASAWFRHR